MVDKRIRRNAHEHENEMQEEIGATSGKTHREVLEGVLGPERTQRVLEGSDEDAEDENIPQ